MMISVTQSVVSIDAAWADLARPTTRKLSELTEIPHPCICAWHETWINRPYLGKFEGIAMLKFLGTTAGIIFLIGLLVVIGLLALIF
jgi:hypothetical protein